MSDRVFFTFTTVRFGGAYSVGNGASFSTVAVEAPDADAAKAAVSAVLPKGTVLSAIVKPARTSLYGVRFAERVLLDGALVPAWPLPAALKS